MITSQCSVVLLLKLLVLSYVTRCCKSVQSSTTQEEQETSRNLRRPNHNVTALYDEEYVRVMVGFHDIKEENDFVRQQKMQERNSNSRPKAKVKYRFQKTRALAMEVTKSQLEEMEKDSRVSFIDEDILVPVASPPTPINATKMERHSRQLFEFESYGIQMTQADRTINPYPFGNQECAVYTCVVDSGVYLNHNDIPYSKGDGYVAGKSFGDAEGQDWANPRNTDHGTYVAGIMIARGGNGRGIRGVIPQGPRRSNVCLRVAKVVPNGKGSALISSLLQASEWCAEEAAGKPVVINLSFAVTSETRPEAAIYKRLYDQGALIVAASGNLGNSATSYPASHDSVISVAAIDKDFQRAKMSQFNDKVELSAPGSFIYVAQAQSNQIVATDGTSLASAFVAGLAARVWAAAPFCSNLEIRQALRYTARRLGREVPNNYYGYGLIRARDAHDLLIGADCYIAPSAQPTPAPTLSPAPSISPTSSISPSFGPTTSSSPTITCRSHLEICGSDNDCCEGYFCRGISGGTGVCRNQRASYASASLGGRPRPPRLRWES